MKYLIREELDNGVNSCYKNSTIQDKEGEPTMTTSMNKITKQNWSAALRSGEYTQYRGGLVSLGEDGEPQSFCCLGVLVELFIKDNSDPWGADTQSLIDSLGFGAGGRIIDFIRMNDDEKLSFEQIADYIDSL